MNFKKILSGILAVMMTMTAVSFTLGAAAQEADAAADSDTLVIHYSKIQKGNVDNKIKATVDAEYNDPDMGSVVKVSPLPDTSEQGAVNIDGYGIDSLKIDVTKYNYVSVEYKYVSDYANEVKPQINFLTGTAKILSKSVTVTSNEALKKNEWSTVTFNMGSAVKPLVNEGKQYQSQIHFYPFGNAVPSSFAASDYILIRNFTFSVDNPNGDVFYTASFESGDAKAVGTAPADIKARFDDKFTLPEIPFTHPTKTASGWLAGSGTKVYQPGDEYSMPERDTSFTVVWQEDFIAQSLIELPFQQYYNGICDNKDTATAEKADYEGMPVVAVTPNTASTSGAINLDGWSYGGAKIHVEEYKTIIVIYKYVSSKPVTGKQNLNIMSSGIFSKATSMTSREDIVANRWAVASFDLTPAISNIKEGTEPIIKQMHYYPLGSNKVEALDSGDRIYVAKMLVIPEATDRTDYHEAYMSGYTDGTFGVSGNMTRAEAATVVARLTAGGDASVPTDKTTAFTDVAADQWYHKYVSYIEGLGYLGSYSGTFAPNQAITRAEFVELVYNMGLLQDAGKNGTFTDVPADHPKAAVVSAAGKAGLVNGYANGDGTFSFRPDATITRAEVVKVINNAYGKKPGADGIFETSKNLFTDVTPDHWAYADIIDAAQGHISYIGEAGTEVWIAKTGAESISEDFTPDYQAGLAKMAETQALFDKRVAEIRATESSRFDIKGTTYYVSASGNDANDGKSEAAPFATATQANKVAKAGDLVLFKRGDEWRERWVTVSGVTYSAYGTGAKPIFNGNLFGDAADESLWTLVDGTTNIWKYEKTTADIGNIVINGGEKTIEKIVPTIKDGQHYLLSTVFDPATSFAKNETFISLYGTINGIAPDIDNNSTLYVRCDEGNPGKVYNSIELCARGSLISVKSNVTMDNIMIQYTGSHGFAMGTVSNVRFQNLEIGYIGGAAQYYTKGNMVRFGNGIEVYGGCDGFYIDNCYVYQCYDAGITNQISSGGTNDVIEQNVYFTNNVIDKCIYNIEYFMGKADNEVTVRLLKNINYTGNLLARSGYGWGMSPGRSASIKGWDHYNRAEGFVIENNTFFLDKVNACDLGASMSAWLPEFKGNTYIQKYNNTFTKVGANGSSQFKYTGQASAILDNIGETEYKLYYVPSDTVVE